MDQSLMGAAGSPAPSLADRFYPKATKAELGEAPTLELAELRHATESPASKLYATQASSATRELALAVNPSGTESVLGQAALEFSQAAVDMGMTEQQVSRLAALARTATANPMTADQQRTAELDSIKALRDQYGPDFDAAFSAARALAQRDPRVKQWLDRSGLGSSRDAVLMFAEAGLAQARLNRLKT